MVPSNGYAYFDERQPRPCKVFSSKSYMGPTRKFYLIFLMLPSIIAFWYAIAIFFPPSWRENVPFFIWTNSGLLYDTNGEVFVCPKEFICAKGILQVLLLVLARITAYTSFVVQGLVFISKMHSLIYHLSSTYAALFLPFESLHNMHAFVGSAYFVMIMIHSFSHLVRWSLRQELDSCTSRVGVSGIIGMIAMIVSVTMMSSLAKSESACLFTIPYGIRRTFHRLGSLSMALALLAHTKRTMAISLIFTLAWAIDYLYDILRRTHRLDIVEFSTLPDGTGTQMLWRNQNGFRPKSGEYVQVMVPWLPHGGQEWHPFSTYLHEATKEGMNEINRNDVGEEIVLDKKIDGVQEIDARKTALILIGFQNEFIDPKGLLYDDVKAVIKSTQCVPKIENLLQVARKAGFHIIHAPVSYTPDTPDRPNKCARVPNKLSSGKYFSEGSWNAEIITQLQPGPFETVLDIKCALDCFEDNILEKILVEKGINTLVFGGLLTNGCVESTMRTAYTKNFNNVALVDGTACNSNTEQLAAVNFNFKMFATCMTCSEIRDILENKIAIANNAMRRSSCDNSFAKINDKNEMSMHSLHGLDLEGAEFINVVLESEKSLENFCVDSLSRPYSDIVDTAIAARKGLEQHETTQVFIFSSGDWTQGLVNELGEREKMSPCWVRGPYVSPFYVASNFQHVVLVASNIGITPALGVIGQYPGSSKNKVIIWMCRSKSLIKFFTPLFKDAHLTIIYYTGRDELSPTELKHIYMYGNIFIQQSRPESLVESIACIIVHYERKFASDKECSTYELKINTMNDLSDKNRSEWALLYCGGVHCIKKDLSKFAKKTGIYFQTEMFG